MKRWALIILLSLLVIRPSYSIDSDTVVATCVVALGGAGAIGYFYIEYWRGFNVRSGIDPSLFKPSRINSLIKKGQYKEVIEMAKGFASTNHHLQKLGTWLPTKNAIDATLKPSINWENLIDGIMADGSISHEDKKDGLLFFAALVAANKANTNAAIEINGNVPIITAYKNRLAKKTLKEIARYDIIYEKIQTYLREYYGMNIPDTIFSDAPVEATKSKGALDVQQ